MKSMIFDTKDVIKLVGFAFTITAMWADLKSDLQVLKATTEIRLNSLENPRPTKEVASYHQVAIMPGETKIEGE